MSGYSPSRHCRQRSAAQHSARRRARRRYRRGREKFPVCLDQIVHRDALYEAYQTICREGGSAPGSDGVTYAMLSPPEVGEMLGMLSARLSAGTYLPQPTRAVVVPKKSGSGGTRRLRLPTVLDRAVNRSVLDRLGPLWEGVFLPCSYGFRPARSNWQMLAQVGVTMERSDRWVLAVDDVRNAFDNVPVEEVVTCHRRLLDKLTPTALTRSQRRLWSKEVSQILKLVRTVLTGGDLTRDRGIDQGNAFAPCALNALLHRWLDAPLTDTMREPLWSRYADNVVYLARSVTEGAAMLGEVSRRLDPLGMTLKGEDGVIDLRRGGEAHLLGFTVRYREGRISYGLGQRAAEHLTQALCNAHAADDPPTAARQSVMGWVASYGPAFEDDSVDAPALLALAATHGLREIASPDDVVRQGTESRLRWLRLVRGIRDSG